MKARAQAGLEYLMTYGWALILIATIIGALVFVISGATSETTFSVSDPTKFLLKGSIVSSGTATVKMQNITGGKIEITSISSTGSDFSGCTLNEKIPSPASPIEVKAGGEINLECLAIENNSGAITISYENFAGLPQTIGINASGGGQTGGTSQTCGNNVQEGTEECDGTDLAGQTCITQGFISGTLACSSCSFDFSGCVSGPSCGDGTCNPGECASGCTDCDVTKCCGTPLSGGCDTGVGETYATCAGDCCESDCTAVGPASTCRSQCNGVNGCVLVPVCNGLVLGAKTCVTSTQSATCCKTATNCSTGWTCSGGTCNDTDPPTAITNLATVSNSGPEGGIKLTWTAPADDGTAGCGSGNAAAYDIRYRKQTVATPPPAWTTPTIWSGAFQITGEPAPIACGSIQTLILPYTFFQSDPSKFYCFAMKSTDDIPNTSAVSNGPNCPQPSPAMPG